MEAKKEEAINFFACEDEKQQNIGSDTSHLLDEPPFQKTRITSNDPNHDK